MTFSSTHFNNDLDWDNFPYLKIFSSISIGFHHILILFAPALIASLCNKVTNSPDSASCVSINTVSHFFTLTD